MVEYCLSDVAAIHQLYKYFSGEGLLEKYADQLRRGGEQYIRYGIRRCFDIKGVDAMYVHSPLQPMGILDDVVTTSSSSPKQTCTTCKQEVPSGCTRKKKPRCEVCRALDIQKAVKKCWERDEKAEGELECYEDDIDSNLWFSSYDGNDWLDSLDFEQ